MPPPLTPGQRADIEVLIRNGESSRYIAGTTNVGREQIDKMKRNLLRYGVVVAPHAPMGRPRKFTEEMEAHLLEYIDLHPTKFLDEMCWFIFDMWDITVSESTGSLGDARWQRNARSISKPPPPTLGEVHNTEHPGNFGDRIQQYPGRIEKDASLNSREGGGVTNQTASRR